MKEIANDILAEARRTREYYNTTGRDFDKVQANMYSIFECYAHGLISWDQVKTRFQTSIREYVSLYKGTKHLKEEIEIMRQEYKNVLRNYKPALDQYKAISEQKLAAKLATKKNLSESVAQQHSNTYYNNRLLSESAINDTARLETWKRVMEAYPNLTAKDEARVRMLTIFEGPTIDTTQMITSVIDEASWVNGKETSGEKRWKQTSMSPAQAREKYGKDNVRVKKAALRNGDDMVEVFTEGHSPHPKGSAKYKKHMAAMHAGMNESHDENYIEVAVSSALSAINALADARIEYETNGSNYYIFPDEQSVYDALEVFKQWDVEVEHSNLELDEGFFSAKDRYGRYTHPDAGANDEGWDKPRGTPGSAWNDNDPNRFRHVRIEINGKPWKVVAHKNIAFKIKDTLEKKGKQVELYYTDEAVSESVNEVKNDDVEGFDTTTIKALADLKVRYPHAPDTLGAILRALEDVKHASMRDDRTHEKDIDANEDKIKELEQRIADVEKDHASMETEATRDEENEFHAKLDQLVHKTFGKRKEEMAERKMSKSERAKEERLKDKYDDSGMKQSMKDQYGDDWESVYYATIRKQAMENFAGAFASVAQPMGKMQRRKKTTEAHPNSKVYDDCWDGYEKVPGKKRGEKGSCRKK